MAIVPNIINTVAGINQRKRQGRVREAMGNFMGNEQATIDAIMEDDPDYAIRLRNMMREQTMQDQDRNRLLTRDGLSFLRGVPEEQQDAALAALQPTLRQGGLSDDGFGALRQALGGNRQLANNQDPDVWKRRANAYGPRTIQAGQQLMGEDGEIIARGEYAMRPITIPTADGGTEVVLYDPNKGQFVTEGGGAASPEQSAAAQQAMSAGPEMTVEALRPHFIAQESSGDYTAVNSETGALGAYQVMPATGKALAERLGLPWRPNMMTGNSPEARAYQDRIGGAAIEEAIGASGGDPRTAFMYYHGGSNRDIWGPRTRKYAEDMQARWGGGQQAAPQQQGGVEVSPTRIRSSGANRPGRYRTARPDEIPTGFQGGQIDTQTGEFVNGARTPAPRAPTAASSRQQAKDDARTQAQGMTSNMLTQMARDYVELSGMDGAIVDSRRGAGNNIEAWFASSTLGQFMAGMAGTEAQSTRQRINQMRPLLLNQVRQASEMGARGLDSNKELEFYLQAATDPGRELIANFAAIQVLDTAYGNGDSLATALPPELFEQVQAQAIQLAGENGSGYLFENTGRQTVSPTQGWGTMEVID